MLKTTAISDTYQREFEAFQQSLSQEPLWLQQLRQQAWTRFQEIGFPTARRGNEPWKYTNVVPLANSTFRLPVDTAPFSKPAEIQRVLPWSPGSPRIVFINGRYSQSLSATSHAGPQVMNLPNAIFGDGDLVVRHLAQQATFQDDGLVALNTAFTWDGAFVHIPPGQYLRAPLHLLFLTTDNPKPTVSFPRTLIVAGEHSKVTIVESYLGLSNSSYFTDAVTEIVLGQGAQVELYRLILEGQESFHVGISRVWQGRDSTFSSTTFARGCALGRHDLRILLDAPGSSCFLNGLYITADAQHIDNYINIDHAQPYTTSRLYYKGILDGKSRAIFGGTVLVRPGAVKADAEQKDKNLLLSEEAEVDSKPSLEIYADDVKCGHGATAGALADDALFYMTSRGLDPQRATVLLIKGFASEILNTIHLAPLRTRLERLIMKALSSVPLGRKS